MNGPEHVRILFRYFSNALEQETVETLWAVAVDAAKGHFRLDSIPFYGPPVSSEDIVHAVRTEAEQMLTYQSTVMFSGHSTVQVIVLAGDAKINEIREIFRKLGCPSERINESFFAMDIPSEVDYRLILKELQTLESKQIIEFAEPCLSEKHRNQKQ